MRTGVCELQGSSSQYNYVCEQFGLEAQALRHWAAIRTVLRVNFGYRWTKTLTHMQPRAGQSFMNISSLIISITTFAI